MSALRAVFVNDRGYGADQRLAGGAVQGFAGDAGCFVIEFGLLDEAPELGDEDRPQ